MPHFKVSFDIDDDRPNANTGDFKDELTEFYQQAYLENRMTNVTVNIDYAKEQEEVSRRAKKKARSRRGSRCDYTW